jgi:hypothetical protein
MTQAVRRWGRVGPLLAVLIVAGGWYAVATTAAQRPAAGAAATHLEARFDTIIRPFLQGYCVSCHGGENPEAELDLNTFSSLSAALGDPRWTLVLERLEREEMPAPEADKFPSPQARRRVVEWFQALRDDQIRRNAGDPGIVLARRLSHVELNYTIRDLTGVDIRPTREFPVDPSNPAGFDNSGESLTMSPALLNKYLKAAREVANHLFLQPAGFGFAPHAMLSDTDRDKYCVHRIIDFYRRQNTDYLDYFEAAWRYKHRTALGRPKATLAEIAADAKVSAKYLATLWSTFEGTPETIGPLATVQAMWRALPAADATRADTARAGREAIRDYVVRLRRKIEPRFLNLAAGGVNAAQQPFMIWKNVQYATHRMKFDPAQLQVEGEPAPRPFLGPEPGAASAFGPGRTVLVTNTPGDPDLVVPAGQRMAYEAAFAKFSRVFPDMFYMQERGRNYFDTTKDRGRYLDAGFHSLMGYFRDDQPLYELILDRQGQAELDAMWLEMDVVAGVTRRMYAQFIENQTTQGGGRGSVPMPPNPTQAAVTSEARIKAVEAAYLDAAGGDDAIAVAAIREYFGWINDRLRSVERVQREAEPRHRDALIAFAGRAYRRPLAAAEKDAVLAYYARCRQDGLGHDDAVRESVVSILMSPDFLYRVDLVARPSAAEVRPLDDHALANRLSYFLWSSMPDEELLARAAAGDLHQPRVIAAQTRRMLKDPRTRALAVEFGGNWLDIRRFEELSTVDRERFPSFTGELRQAMFEEPVRFLLDVFQKNRPILDLLYATDTFVNPVLARHYGMAGIAPAPGQWVQVKDATPYQRGGLLPMAAFLTKNAPGLRTSPVKRGNWVVKNVLGERISPPPAGVPQLPEDEAKLDLPLRDAMARHRSDPQCAKCHARFDALGLVFEGYGPVGERRASDLAGRAVDESATFPGGSQGAGLEGLRRYIRGHRQREFVENLSGKLLAFALGRSLVLTDGPLIEDMARKLEGNGYRFDSMVEAIVTSRQFLTRRASLPFRQASLPPRHGSPAASAR